MRTGSTDCFELFSRPLDCLLQDGLIVIPRETLPQLTAPSTEELRQWQRGSIIELQRENLCWALKTYKNGVGGEEKEKALKAKNGERR